MTPLWDQALTISVVIDIHPFTENGIVWKTRKGEWTLEDYHAKRRRAQKLARIEWRRAGQPTLHGRVLVNVHVRRSSGALLDEPNIWGGLKGFIDGLFVKGITPDDSPRYFKCGEVTQESDPRYIRRELIRFQAVPLEPQQQELFNGSDC